MCIVTIYHCMKYTSAEVPVLTVFIHSFVHPVRQLDLAWGEENNRRFMCVSVYLGEWERVKAGEHERLNNRRTCCWLMFWFEHMCAVPWCCGWCCCRSWNSPYATMKCEYEIHAILLYHGVFGMMQSHQPTRYSRMSILSLHVQVTLHAYCVFIWIILQLIW